ncbi:hypothetical protein DSUL_230004 [Desulfovibrionales bacterium]
MVSYSIFLFSTVYELTLYFVFSFFVVIIVIPFELMGV